MTRNLSLRNECVDSFEGNTDLYGIGIRIGLYLQWLSMLFVTLFVPEDEQVQRIINLIVQAALLSALCIISNSDTNQVEPLIVMWLLCGSLSSLTGGSNTHTFRLSGILRALFYAALFAYSIWYWFLGLDQMAHGKCNAVGFFGRFSITGRFRIFGKVISIIGAAICLFILSISAYLVIWKRRGIAFGNKRMPGRGRIELSLVVSSVGLIVVSVMSVEYLIKVNNISGTSNIESVGQLIPLIIGAVSCSTTLFKLIIDKAIFKKKCVYLFGRHL
jgi:hypothetical protein